MSGSGGPPLPPVPVSPPLRPILRCPQTHLLPVLLAWFVRQMIARDHPVLIPKIYQRFGQWMQPGRLKATKLTVCQPSRRHLIHWGVIETTH